MKLKKVLIVDDNDGFRAMLREFLRRNNLGIEIFEASTGEMGVTKAGFIQPDIVLMDINLPSVNGFEAGKLIKNDHPECDVIILTMFEVKVFKKVATGINVTDFIGKSEIDERLIPVIKRCLRSKNQ